MVVPSATNKSGPYSGNGVTTVFEYSFKVTDADHLRVVQTLEGAETDLTTGFTISGIGNDAGGNVTFTTPPASGVTITLLRSVPVIQSSDYSNQGTVPPETVESDLDLAVMRDQQLTEILGRTMLLSTSSTASTVLPSPSASKYIGWNSAGTALENLTGPTADTGVLTFDSVSDLAAATVPGDVDYVRTFAYSDSRAGGGALFRRTGSAPSHEFKAASNGGATHWVGVPEKGEIDIRQLGAVADGAGGTQNQTFIDNAFAAAEALNCGVLVPGGTFRCDGPTVHAGVPMRGIPGQSILAASSASANVLNLTTSGAGYSVSGIKFVGQNLGDSSGNTNEANAIFGSNVSDVEIVDCEFEKFGSEDHGNAGAIHIQGASGFVSIRFNKIKDGLGSGVAADINIYSATAEDVEIVGNDCLSPNRQGISFQIGGTSGKRKLIAFNNCQNHSQSGITLGYADDSSDNPAILCTNNFCHNCMGTGIYYPSGTASGGEISIVDNVCTHCGGLQALPGGTTQVVTNGLPTYATIGEDLQGGIVVSANLPIDIGQNMIAFTGQNEDLTNRDYSSPSIRPISQDGAVRVFENLLDGGTAANPQLGPGIQIDASSRDAILHRNKLRGLDILIVLSSGVNIIDLDGNEINNSHVDRRGIYVQHTQAHGNANIRYNRNRLHGSKSGGTTKGFNAVFGFVGQFTGNEFYNWDIGHDLGNDTTVDYWDGKQIFWTGCVYENCDEGVRYNQTTNANGPPISLANTFRDNDSHDIRALADASLYHAISIGGGNLAVWGTAAPTFGTWAVGDRVQNSNPSVGNPKGWVCTVAGAPGTWVSEGNL